MMGEKVVATRRQNLRPCRYSNGEPAKYVSKPAVLFCWSWRIGNGERTVIADSLSGKKKDLNLNNQTLSVSFERMGNSSIDAGLAEKTRHQQ